jgi:uncharacterized protein (UPF0276 family)
VRSRPWEDAPTAAGGGCRPGPARPAAPTFRAPAPVGVGCTVIPSHLDLLDRVRHLVDVVEVCPGLLAQQRPTPDGGLRTHLVPSLVDRVLGAIEGLPVVVHDLALSIGSVECWNTGALALLDDLGRQGDHRWHSDHLGFLEAVGSDGSRRHAGLVLPLPHSAEAADLVGARAAAVQAHTGRPFLLENVATTLTGLPADPGWDEARLLAEVCERSGCGLLLDVAALQANAAAGGHDVWAVLERLPLDRVVEVHVGGAPDPGSCPQPPAASVGEREWALAEWVLRRAPQVGALIVEGSDPSGRPDVGTYVEQLDRAVDLWHWSRAAPLAGAAPRPGATGDLEGAAP